MCELSRIILKRLVKVILGVFFLLSAAAKLSAMESFELYIFSFGFAGFDICAIAARILIIAEFIIGICMAFNLCYRYVKWVTAAFLAGFSIFLLWRAIIGDAESCHCMGDIVDMTPAQSLIKNAVMGCLLSYAWNHDGKSMHRQNLAASLALAVVTLMIFIVSPPDFYYRRSSDSNDLDAESFMPVADSLGLSTGRRVICFYSVTCEHCMHCASKMAGIIKRHSIPSESVHVVFMQTHENQDSVATAFFSESGEGVVLPSDYLHPFSFIPLTNGSMPLVVLYEEGQKVKEYDYISIDENEIASFIMN